jgi:NADH dehydrogenase FAD-containing subunit
MKTATTYEQRLLLRIDGGGSDGVDAAVALMERHDPDSLEAALTLVDAEAELGPDRQKTVITAWDRYFHIRAMSWD